MADHAARLYRLFTDPTGASTKINGRPAGITSPSGLMVLCKQGDQIVLEKRGFEKVNLAFSSPRPASTIKIKLRPIAYTKPPDPQREPQQPGPLVHQGGASPLPTPQAVGSSPQRASRSFFSLRWITGLVVVPLLAGFVVGSFVYYSGKPSAAPGMSPLQMFRPGSPDASVVTPARALPPPINPARSCNLVLARNEKMDKIIETVEHVLKFTNDERAQRGIPPLKSSAALALIAQNNAENMCEARTVEHDAAAFPNGWNTRADRLKLVGLDSGLENIAREKTREPESSAKWLVKGWILSESARKRMLDPSLQYVGIGICPGPDKTVYAAQVFSVKPGGIR